MKTANLIDNSHLKYSQYSTLHSKTRQTTSENKEGSVERNIVNTSAIKTTAGENPSGRLSFKASINPDKAMKAAAKAEKLKKTLDAIKATPVEDLKKTFFGKLSSRKSFNGFLDLINKNSLIADALIALGFTAILRPASIYAIPAKDKHTKKKNNYQVAHSIATGAMGLGTTMLVSEPVRRGFDKFFKDPAAYLKKGLSDRNAQKIVKRLKGNEEVYKQTMTRFHQPIFLPLRAIVTILIIPPLLEMMGLSKHPEKDAIKPSDKAKIDYSFMAFKGGEKKTFGNFSSINNAFDHNHKEKINAKKSNNTPSFKGGLGGVVTEQIAKGMGQVASTGNFQKFINWFKQTNWMPHLIAAESLWLSGFYMFQSGKSKNIEKDQKLPLILNQGITAVLCTIGAYKLDGSVKAQLKKLKAVYEKLNPELANQVAKNGKKVLDNRLGAIGMLAPLVIFTAIYRFVGPVVVTPIANWLSEKIEPHKKAKSQPAMAAAK